MSWKIIQSRQFPILKYFYSTKTGESTWYTPCDIFKGLQWTENSCYLDSVLICLFSTPSAFVFHNILYDPVSEEQKTDVICKDKKAKNKVRKELVKIYNTIRGLGGDIETCKDLRKKLKKCKSSQKFHRGNIQDAGEFLIYLLGIFETNKAYVRQITFATNSETSPVPERDLVMTSNKLDIYSSVVNSIYPDDIKIIEDNRSLSDFIQTRTDSGILDDDNLFKVGTEKYKRRITIRNLEYTPYLIFYLIRKSLDIESEEEIVLYNKIKIDDSIQIGENNYELSGIVLYIESNKHYVSIIKCKDKYLYYDDLNDEGLLEIESLDDSPVNPYTNGVLFFYKPLV